VGDGQEREAHCVQGVARGEAVAVQRRGPLAVHDEHQHQQVPDAAVTETADHREQPLDPRIAAATIHPQAERLLDPLEALPECNGTRGIHVVPLRGHGEQERLLGARLVALGHQRLHDLRVVLDDPRLAPDLDALSMRVVDQEQEGLRVVD